MTRTRRLARLEAERAAAEQAKCLPIMMRWETRDGPVEEGPRDALLTIHLTGSRPPNCASACPDADPMPEPKPVRPRGQRPPPPTEQEMEAARAELTRRWANGTWVGAPEMVVMGGDHGIPIRRRSARPAAPNANFDPVRLLR
jgi:hypothetical protein